MIEKEWKNGRREWGDLSNWKDIEAIWRPAPFWSWNDKLDAQELRRQIREMAAKGWGGYFMHSRVGLVTGYLSPEWMEMVRACAEEARKTGTYAWLYDEDKWPSGFAGGEVPEADPRFRSRALVLLKEGQVTENDTVLAETTEGGTKYLICRRISPLGNLWFNGASYVDLMNPEAVRFFIESTHERYKNAVGEYFGKEIPGIFTDEPCYLMEGHYSCPAVPWSDYLPEYFANRNGYRIEDNLVQLFFDVGDYQRVRFDFYDAVTRLFRENFTKQYYGWCEANDLKMTGHFMAEDNLAYQTQWIGAAMPHYEFMHWPGIDKLGRHIEQLVTVKQVSSAVDQLGKERAFCEVFGCVGQQVSFYHRKWIADWEAVLGISFVNHHLSLYSMRGERKRDYPADLFYQQPWWEEERGFADYIGRLCKAVTVGQRMVDILVIHPIGSVWSEYSPLHKQNGLPVENGMYNRPFEELSKALMAAKLDFHYGDEIIMEDHARVEGKRLRIGVHTYGTVIVPPVLTLRKNTLSLLTQFAAAGGNLILIRPCPVRCDGRLALPDLPGAAKRLDSVREAISFLDTLYPKRVKIIDQMTGANAEKVLCHGRRAVEGVYFLIANTDEKREVRATLSFPALDGIAMIPALIDLNTGDEYSAPGRAQDGMWTFDAKFAPAGSLFIFFPSLDQPQINVISESTMAHRLPAAPPFLASGVTLEEKLVMVVDEAEGECRESVEMAGPRITSWMARCLEENVLPLGRVSLELNGQRVLQDAPVAKAWHEYFYRVPDGTPFRAEYTFEVENVPEGEVSFVIEMAENLDRILCNGTVLRPLKTRGEMGAFDPRRSWKDVNFTRVPAGNSLRPGVNILVLEGRKVNNITGPGTHRRVKDFQAHQATEVETVYLVGDFIVHDFDHRKFVIDGRVAPPDARDLTKSGYPFYAGLAEFSSRIDFANAAPPPGKRIFLELGAVSAAVVEVRINGQKAGVRYWEPYVVEITNLVQPGENLVQVVAATTLFNLMGPNWIAGIEEDTGVSPWTFVDFRRYTDKYALRPFGIGEARILFL